MVLATMKQQQQYAPKETIMEGGGESWSHRAMEWSHAASRHLQKDRLEDSIYAYHQALEIYQRAMSSHNTGGAGDAGSDTVISLCNAGSCWRNLGAIHRKRKSIAKAMESWKHAEELYRHGRDKVLQQRQRYPYQPGEEDEDREGPVVSLDAYLVETLQTRATLETRPKDAIDCHEEALDLLLESSGDWHVRLTETMGTVVFGPMEQSRIMEHLIISLQALGSLYLATGAYQDGLPAFEDALERLRQNIPPQGRLGTNVAKIYQTLSEVYLEKEDLDRATEALLEAFQVQSPATDGLLDAMDRMGRVHEEQEDYDRAMSLYEKVLLTRNQVLGSTHVHVAKSLINVARVMELQGNEEGSLDIYRVAQAIYTRQVTSSEFRVAPEDVQSLLRLIPNVMEQGRYEEAVAYLNKCLESNNEQLDKTQIYFDLGQAYIGMGDYVSATVCLVECAKQDGAVSDEQIGQLLDHVEFLKQEQQQAALLRSYPSSASGSVNDDNDDGDDDLEDHDDTRSSEEENHSHTSFTDQSPAPRSTSPVSNYDAGDEEDVVKQIPLSDEEEDKRVPLSPRKTTRDQANATPITAEFSRTTSKGASIEDRTFSFSDLQDDSEEDAKHSPLGRTFSFSDVRDDNVNDAEHDESMHTPQRLKEFNNVTPGTPSEMSTTSELSGASGIPSPIRSLSPTAPKAKESGRQSSSRTGPSDEENDLIEEDIDAIVEWNPELALNQSADSKALLQPSHMDDELPSPGRQFSKSKSRSLSSPIRLKSSSPRRRIETKTSDTVKEKKNRFRRRRRHGFESLPDGPRSRTPSPSGSENAAAATLERDNEYHLDESSFVNAPVRVIKVEQDWDDVSEISYNPHGRSAQNKRTNEWWWGVTAEGFGRWFPSNFVSQAVEAADGFLSAKAIHSRVKSAPLHVSEDESTDERESQPTEEQASHLGVTSRKHSAHANGSTEASRNLVDPMETASGNMAAVVGATSPRRRKRQDVLSDIRECSQQIAEQRMKLDETDPALGDTLFRLALLHGQNQNIGSAMEAATSALRIQKLNSNFVVSARTLHFLAGLQLQERQYKSALNYYSEALRLETNLYGKFSEECAKTLNAIGTVRSLQNEFKLAMDSHKEALNVLKECHGDDLHGNPLVSQTLCQIGAVYYRERNSLSTIKSKTGDYTTFIEAGMLEIIGRAHEERGSYKMAIAFFEEKLQFLENAPESDVTRDEMATTLNSLGMLSSRAGLFMEAVDYYDRALSLQMKIENDIVYMSTAKVLTATVQFQLGFWHKALQLLREALPILQKELGEKHETVAATHYHIGATQAAMCDYDAAMTSLSYAYEVQQSLLGVAHPASLRTRREIGNLYSVYRSEVDYSLEIFSEVLAAQQRIHGTKHPNIAETLHSIGVAYAQKGADSTALKTLEECYYMRLEFLGVDHPLQANTLHEIAKIHMKKGRARKATSICDTVLEIRKESLSEWHIDYARALAIKGSSLSMRGEFEEATSCLDEAFRVAKQSVFAAHPAIGEIQLEMGLLWLRKCQFGEAKKSVEIAADIFRKANFDEDHPGLQRVADLLDRIERDEALYV
eukprot:scaffold538_cov166-Amphora_coffeaeformis.AAC.15